ncbi:MAG: hypothetical protein H3Z51_11375 [archaeon]|nr:hypothetical protein [archaeon]
MIRRVKRKNTVKISKKDLQEIIDYSSPIGKSFLAIITIVKVIDIVIYNVYYPS